MVLSIQVHVGRIGVWMLGGDGELGILKSTVIINLGIFGKLCV